ncbi:MAG TPA: GDP-mannose 4,6-dehydratase [Patescibacteria group bacterium]|nr:GDP-mannose 4,6-dehydratase [Patescibacteria group bacterium]
MKHVFVTGGTGLVGGHVVEELLKAHPDANLVVLARSRDPKSYFFERGLDQRVILYTGDIRDEKLVRDIVFNEEIDTIFHLAAQPLVTVALANPRQTWETNLIGTLNILEAARGNTRIRSVVVASSDKAYGEAKFLPYTEDHPLHGLHPYDASKSCEDLMAQTYAKCYGVPVVVSRFGNIFGPGDLNFNRTIPGAMRALATGVPMEIRSSGHLVRDYVFVKDVARAYLLLEKAAETHAGHAFNVTSGINLSLIQMLNEMERVLAVSVPRIILNNASHEIPEQRLSDDKFRRELGWRPNYSLDEAIRETWSWYRTYFTV